MVNRAARLRSMVAWRGVAHLGPAIGGRRAADRETETGPLLLRLYLSCGRPESATTAPPLWERVTGRGINGGQARGRVGWALLCGTPVLTRMRAWSC